MLSFSITINRAYAGFTEPPSPCVTCTGQWEEHEDVFPMNLPTGTCNAIIKYRIPVNCPGKCEVWVDDIMQKK